MSLSEWAHDHMDALMERTIKAEMQRDELLRALKDVVRIADRKTVEFDAARDAIAKAEQNNAQNR